MADRRQELIDSLATEGVDISEFTPITDTLSPAGQSLRKQELIESLKADGVDVDIPQPARDPMEEAQYQQDVMKVATDPNTATIPVSDIMTTPGVFLANEDVIEEDVGIEKQGFVDTFKELKELDKLAKRLPVVGSVYKLNRTSKLLDSVDIINGKKKSVILGGEGIFGRFGLSKPGLPLLGRPVTEKDKEKAMDFVVKWMEDVEKAQNRTTGGKFANAALAMPSFIIEFMLTGPIFKSGSVATKATATKLLGKYANNMTGKLAIRAAGAGFGSLARTAVNVPRVLSGAAERMTKGLEITDDGTAVFADAERNPFTAVAKSFTDLYIENLSEIAGGAIGEGAGKAIKFTGKLAKKFPFINKATEEIAEAWIKNAPKGTERTLSQFLTKATTKVGFNGILGEFTEERLGDIMRSATGLQDWNEILITKEEALIEAGIFSLFGGVNLASEKIFRTDAPKAEPVTETSVLTRKRELEIAEGEGRPPTDRELAAFLNLGAGKAGEKLFESSKITEQQRQEVKDKGKLFTSTKNKALSDAESKEAVEFIDSSIKGNAGKGIILPGDDPERDIKIVNAATKASALLANAKTPPVAEPASDIKRAITRNIARAEDAVGDWGKTGVKVQKDLREIAFRTAVNVGNTASNIKIQTKGLNKAEKETVAKLIDGAITEVGQPNRLVQRARAIREELDVIQNEALDIGLRRNALSGKAFPQVLTKEGQELLQEAEKDGPKSSKVFAWAQTQVTDGKFETVDDAIIALQGYREGLISGKEGYVEGNRTLEIGNEFREWNLDKILAGTIESSWEKVEAARQWGVLKDVKTDGGQLMLPFKDIQIDIAKLRADVGKNEANALNQYLKAQYGISGADTAIMKASQAVRTTQFVGKLAFSPLTISRNILDRYSKGLTHGTFYTNARASIKYPPFMNHWMKSARNIEDQMVRGGAVLGHGHLSEGFTGGEGAMSLIAKPFASSEKGNQAYIALVKKLQLESDVKRLMELDGRDGPMSKSLDRLAFIVGQSQSQTKKRVLTDITHEQLADAMAKEGQIPDDVMAEALHRTVTDSAFPLTLASKRLWWDSKPVLQAATQFKVWSADQTRFIYKDVLKYGVETGDWSRFARFMIGTWLAGEMYNIARDELLNKDESVLSKVKGGSRDEIAMAIGKDLIDGGVVGMLADFTYGIGDWAAGPTTNSISGIATAIDQSRGTATLPEALGQFLLSDAPALRQVQGTMDSLDSIFDKNNLTEDYSRWQGRSFDFRRKDGESVSDIQGGKIMRMLRGTPPKKATERSLSLNMIARQVLVGDYDDAAQHIKRVIRDTEVQDMKGVVQSLNTSMRNNSPFGNIQQKKLIFFLQQFSPKEAVKGIELQEQWSKGYKKSIETALKELKAEGFVEEFNDAAKAYQKELKPKIEEARKFMASLKKEMSK
jgi:hypothetical protein